MMNRDLNSLFQEMGKCMMEGKLHQAFDWCIQAGNLAFSDPDLLSDSDLILDIGLHFGELGNQCIDKNDYQLAINAYWITLILIPEDYEDNRSDYERFLEHPTIRYLLGKCYIELKQWDDAISVLEGIKKEKLPAGQEASLFETLGDLYYSLESYDEGIEEYKAILEYKKEGNYIPQSDIEYAIERIKWAYQIQNKQKNLLDFVENLFENYFNLDLLANDVYAQYVELAENLGREYYKEALLNAVIFHDDENGIDSLTSDEEPEQYCLDALERLADIYLGEKDYYEAEKYLSAVVQWKEDPEILRNLSRIYIRQGQIGAAEEFLDKAKLKEPENVTEWELTAEIQIKKREFKEAKETAENGIKLLQEMNEQNPANSEKISRAIEYLYLKKIDALVNLLQTEDALDELEIARRRFPKTEIFYAYSAILLFLSDRMKETEELINSAENAGINISEKMKDLREAVKSKSKRDKKQK